MYNGIGLQTARGSGTNGYVQANLANLLLSKKRVAYNSEADIKRAEAEINKQPNKELLEHNRKRHIELKCADFEMLMENKGFDEGEIQKKVNEYRKLLQSQVATGELDIDAEMDSHDTHVRAKAAIEKRDRMRSALGINADFVDGTSFEKLNKSVDLKISEAKDDNKKKKKKGKDIKKKGKIRKTASSSSSSSSSSSESSSSVDSSESSSDSDDGSTNSVEESSESSSSEVSEAEGRKKVKGTSCNERKLSERIRESHRHEIRHSSGKQNGDYSSGLSDRKKRRRHDSPDHQSDNHFGCRKSGRSDRYDDEERQDSRRNERRDDWHRRNDSGSDRHRKRYREEKRDHRQKENRSRRSYHYSSDSDTDRKQKRDVTDHSGDGGSKQLGRHSLEEEKYRLLKLKEVIPDAGLKVEPALSPHYNDISSQKVSSSTGLPSLEDSSRNMRNNTLLSGFNTAEITMSEKPSVGDIKMEISSNEDEEKVRRSSGHKKSRHHSSKIHDNSGKICHRNTLESEDRARSSSSSNDEFLHHSSSTRSSTTASNGGAAENILNGNSDEVHSPSHSPEPRPETKGRNKKFHLQGDVYERTGSEKSMRKHVLPKDADDENYRRHGSRGRSTKSCHVSRLESDHGRSASGRRRHRNLDEFKKYKRHYAESSEAKFRRSESYESRHHGHRSMSNDRIHRLRQKSHSSDSSRKRHHESKSRSYNSKRQVSSRSRHHRDHSKSRRSASRIRKSISASKQSCSPKNSNRKSESSESSSEEVRSRRRHDTSSSESEKDNEGPSGKRSRLSSGDTSSSSSNSRPSAERIRKHSNDSGKKRHHQRSSVLREPIEESDS